MRTSSFFECKLRLRPGASRTLANRGSVSPWAIVMAMLRKESPEVHRSSQEVRGCLEHHPWNVLKDRWSQRALSTEPTRLAPDANEVRTPRHSVLFLGPLPLNRVRPISLFRTTISNNIYAYELPRCSGIPLQGLKGSYTAICRVLEMMRTSTFKNTVCIALPYPRSDPLSTLH